MVWRTSTVIFDQIYIFVAIRDGNKRDGIRWDGLHAVSVCDEIIEFCYLDCGKIWMVELCK